MKCLRISLLVLSMICAAAPSQAQDTLRSKSWIKHAYVGYDLGEMAFNQFRNYAGEVGVQFHNDHALRFVHLDVKLTEAHLSSGFASAIDGDSVEGRWKGFELLYDIPVYKFKTEGRYVYAGLSTGYHTNNYQHASRNESVEHKSATVGFDIGYRESNVFKIKGLYYNLQVPVRFYFTPLEEQTLGTSIVKGSKYEQTISFFIGYQF